MLYSLWTNVLACDGFWASCTCWDAVELYAVWSVLVEEEEGGAVGWLYPAAPVAPPVFDNMNDRIVLLPLELNACSMKRGKEETRVNRKKCQAQTFPCFVCIYHLKWRKVTVCACVCHRAILIRVTNRSLRTTIMVSHSNWEHAT